MQGSKSDCELRNVNCEGKKSSNQLSEKEALSYQRSAVSDQLAIPYLTNRPISYSTASPNEPNELNELNELNEPYEPLLLFNHLTT